MYSGTTLTRMSGRMIGTHQKIDRVARRQLGKLLSDQSVFPKARRIVHFEGFHGPDAIKRKSPAKDEPWHYFNPFDDNDTQLIDLIDEHFQLLANELKQGNQERSAFEAAWLAHAVVDGLTPAHHYPYEEELKELSQGAPIESRLSVRKKLIMPGKTMSQILLNNWRAWGPKGLRTSHGLFEMGIATLIAPLQFGDALIRESDITNYQKHGLREWYRNTAREIAAHDMYHTYIRNGWTPKLAYKIRHSLAPSLVRAVGIVWYAALLEAGVIRHENHRR